VFGTHNLRWVPAMVESAARGQRASRTDEDRSLARFDAPERHPGFEPASARRAFLTAMEGCDMFCSFCIVPTTRGREISRPARDILDEAASLARAGVREITLLGQTVNAYGRHDLRRGRAETAGTLTFGELLARIDAVPGIERIRYTSPHPLFFDEALVEAHGRLEHLCPHVHLPAQSGSDAVLERMRRRYGRDRYLGIVAALREARPDIAFSTDLIVGFPGETEDDFEQTLELMRAVGFVDSYSFKYSPRPGTRALDLPDPVPADVAQERLQRLQALQRELTIRAHRSRVGSRTRILVQGASRRGGRQLTGRDPYHRVVNLEPGDRSSAPGDLLDVELVDATPHSLLAVPAASSMVKPGGGFAEEPGRSPLRESGEGVPGSAVRLRTA